MRHFLIFYFESNQQQKNKLSAAAVPAAELNNRNLILIIHFQEKKEKKRKTPPQISYFTCGYDNQRRQNRAKITLNIQMTLKKRNEKKCWIIHCCAKNLKDSSIYSTLLNQTHAFN